MTTEFAKLSSRTALVAAAALLSSCSPNVDPPPGSADSDAKIAKLEERLFGLEQREQIRDVYLRYVRGFDRNDVELLRTAFWPDAQINYSAGSNTVDEFIATHLKQHTQALAAWGHLITNETISIEGDTAHVEAYVTAFWSQKKNPTFSNGLTIVSGRYIDRLDRRGGQWRIAVREFIGHFAATTEAAGYFSKKGDCRFGTWDRRDPSYSRPLKRRAGKMPGAACAQ